MDNKFLKSKTVHIRLAEISDAAFIYSLRMNENLNKHISKVDGTVQDQVVWLEKYKEKEQAGLEYYFIIVRNDNDRPIGTVRLYGITDENQFCWGSWILNSDKTVTAAIESAYLLYKFAFEYKKYHSAYFQVGNNNTQVISFHKKTGAIFVEKDEVNENFIYTHECYSKFKGRYLKVVENN
ncbi:GNAT family N-acetyltransferase [Cedecea neteri]|uniref:GNAT family N-acetyltransferase n=1 Tax=Cedecea neteri TaxID=158822 RepID=UPI002AA754F1|nr:GNAT family N-acetyltransferase [Cedecea neteri]WPU24674.1 GNAT family N-acetyltransferase [Cedecea neteri]